MLFEQTSFLPCCHCVNNRMIIWNNCPNYYHDRANRDFNLRIIVFGHFWILISFGQYFNLLIGMIVQIIMGVLMIISMGVTSACGDLESRDIQIRSKAKKSITAAGCCAFLVGVCVLFTHSVAADVWIKCKWESLTPWIQNLFFFRI